MLYYLINLINSLSNINIYDFGIIHAFFRFILKICWMIQYILQEITSNIPPANNATYLGVSQIDSVDFLEKYRRCGAYIILVVELLRSVSHTSHFLRRHIAFVTFHRFIWKLSFISMYFRTRCFTDVSLWYR